MAEALVCRALFFPTPLASSSAPTSMANLGPLVYRPSGHHQGPHAAEPRLARQRCKSLSGRDAPSPRPSHCTGLFSQDQAAWFKSLRWDSQLGAGRRSRGMIRRYVLWTGPLTRLFTLNRSRPEASSQPVFPSYKRSLPWGSTRASVPSSRESCPRWRSVSRRSSSTRASWPTSRPERLAPVASSSVSSVLRLFPA